MRTSRFLLLLAILTILVSPAIAQIPRHLWTVFLQPGLAPDQLDQIVMIDSLTGDRLTVEVYGERYTPAGNYLIYFDRQLRQIMMLDATGEPRIHPFIRMDESDRRVDWVLSPDSRLIAWTLTSGSTGNLYTRTYVSDVNGANVRLVLKDGPRADGIRVLPVAFSADGQSLHMDAHPDGLERFMPYRQYAGLFRFDFNTGTIETLPGEPGCFCGAGLQAGYLLRLALNSDTSAYDLRVFDLVRNSEARIPAVAFDGLTHAGDVLIAPDGSVAIYILARISDYGTPDQQVRTEFVRVDLQSLTQERLGEPLDGYFKLKAWTEDNRAVLVTSPQEPATWKLNPVTGTLIRIAEAGYIGLLRD